MKHCLPKTTEADIQKEIIQFLEASMEYHAAQLIHYQKKQGHWPMLCTGSVELMVQVKFQDAYEKIPTLWLIELQEMLKQNHITQWQ